MDRTRYSLLNGRNDLDVKISLFDVLVARLYKLPNVQIVVVSSIQAIVRTREDPDLTYILE